MRSERERGKREGMGGTSAVGTALRGVPALHGDLAMRVAGANSHIGHEE
jgi:hypothetical protein